MAQSTDQGHCGVRPPDGVAARQGWMGVLARAPREELERTMADMPVPVPDYVFLRPPETGLVMVRGRMDAVGQRFNLGEMTMTRCAVRIGRGLVGFAFVAGRDHRKAELAAVMDAMLQEESSRAALMESVVEPLDRARRKRRDQERARTGATRVEFFTMVRGEDE